MQYAHDFVFSTFAKGKDIIKHQINGSINNIKRTEIYDKDYIGMSKDASICFDIGTIKPQEKKVLDICVLVDENKNVSAMEDEIDRITKIDLNKEYVNTKAYWRKYLKTHNGLNLKETKNSYEDRIYEIYKRSILLFPLLTNYETGGIIASPEIDENFTKCGRYAYCWPRDAVFMTKAMDIVKMEKETEKFYKTFCKKTQSPPLPLGAGAEGEGTVTPAFAVPPLLQRLLTKTPSQRAAHAPRHNGRTRPPLHKQGAPPALPDGSSGR